MFHHWKSPRCFALVVTACLLQKATPSQGAESISARELREHLMDGISFTDNVDGSASYARLKGENCEIYLYDHQGSPSEAYHFLNVEIYRGEEFLRFSFYLGGDVAASLEPKAGIFAKQPWEQFDDPFYPKSGINTLTVNSNKTKWKIRHGTSWLFLQKEISCDL